MKRLAAIVAIASAGMLLGTVARREPAQGATAVAKGAAVWRLVSDYKLDGHLEPQETNRLVLTAEGQRLSGHFLEMRASGKDNSSSFSGEVVGIPMFHRGPAADRESQESRSTLNSGSGGGPLLVLRQDDGAYSVVYAGRENEHDHFQGTWYDVRGNSGDFELSAEATQSEKGSPHRS